MGKSKKFEDDDGRTIINMNVEGMPWHQKKTPGEIPFSQASTRGSSLTRSQSRLYTWYAVLAGLTIAAVFSVTWILFTLFATQIWFR